MATSSKRDKPSKETVTEAQRIARATQRPGQTKEQTRLIAQGIQKGIDQYKKQHKAKAREMDRRRKKSSVESPPEPTPPAPTTPDVTRSGRHALPWVLLGVSWAFFLTCLVLFVR